MPSSSSTYHPPMAYDLDLALTAHEKLRSKILKAGAASRHTVPVTVQSLKAELQKMQKLYPAVESMEKTVATSLSSAISFVKTSLSSLAALDTSRISALFFTASSLAGAVGELATAMNELFRTIGAARQKIQHSSTNARSEWSTAAVLQRLDALTVACRALEHAVSMISNSGGRIGNEYDDYAPSPRAMDYGYGNNRVHQEPYYAAPSGWDANRGGPHSHTDSRSRRDIPPPPAYNPHRDARHHAFQGRQDDPRCPPRSHRR